MSRKKVSNVLAVVEQPRKQKKIPAPVVPAAIPEDATFITARELAGLLRKTSLKTIYRLAKQNVIAHIHGAGGLLFLRSSVNEYLAARLIPSIEARSSAVGA